MPTKYIKPSAVRKLAKEKGKRVGSNYLAWLDREIERKIIGNIGQLGAYKTLNVEDATAATVLAVARR